MSRLLPPLEIQIDEQSYQGAFGYMDPMNNNTFQNRQRVFLINEFSQYFDAINILEKDIKSNIIERSGEVKGLISSKINFSIDRPVRANGALIFFSIILAGVPNLFGMPATGHFRSFEVEVSIYDLSNNIVGEYSSYCEITEWAALYYGYHFAEISRIATINAFKCAMDNIKLRIEKDYDRIIRLL